MKDNSSVGGTLKLLLITPLSETAKEELARKFPNFKIVDCSRARDRVIDEIEDAELVFGRVKPEEFRAAKKLRFIQHSAHGMEHFQYPEVTQSDVLVANAKGVCDRNMAEHVLGLMLCLTRGIHRSIHFQREKVWRGYARPFPNLEGQTLGGLGTGSVGTEIARLAASLGMRNVGFNRTGKAIPTYEQIYSSQKLNEFLGCCDFVVSSLPHTPQTHYFMGEGEFKAMKPTAYFINVGRGKTVDEAAMVRALQKGEIAGAGLDVFEEEPLPEESPLWEMENVIITPHQAGDGEGNERKIFDLLVENLERFLEGEPLLNLVDLREGY